MKLSKVMNEAFLLTLMAAVCVFLLSGGVCGSVNDGCGASRAEPS